MDTIEVFVVISPWIMKLSQLYLYDTDITAQRPNLAAYIEKPHKDAQRDRIHDYAVRVNVLFYYLTVWLRQNHAPGVKDTAARVSKNLQSIHFFSWYTCIDNIWDVWPGGRCFESS